ncbi:MAG: hypothetical protein Q8Q15_02660 [bacterium]|nr:hypothetical protein [bacterium]
MLQIFWRQMIAERKEGQDLEETTERDRFPLFPSPFVVERGSDGNRENLLTLGEALEKIANSEPTLLEERRGGLQHRLEEALRRCPHGKPRGERVKRDVRAQSELKMKRRLRAIDYPLIDYILRSPKDRPFEISPGVSPLSDSLPTVGDKHPFYSFICERYPQEALELIGNKELVILYNVFFLRLEAYQEFVSGKKLLTQAFERFSESVRGTEIPPEIIPIVGQIAKRFEFSKK